LAIKTLEPIKADPRVEEEVEKEILRAFRDLIFAPLIAEVGLSRSALRNASYSLVDAILKSRITYDQGRFRGKFNAQISKELRDLGAKFNSSKGYWHLPAAKLTFDLRTAISLSGDQFLKKASRIDKIIASLNPKAVADAVKVEKIYDYALWQVEKQLKSTTRGITVVPELTEAERTNISRKYTEDLRRYIQEWTEEEILNLRERVRKSVEAGDRYENLVKTIQYSYGVSANKAQFLARQETNLMTAAYKEARYESAGITEYIWRTVAGSPNHPVRPEHKVLDGQTFRFDNPPITSKDGKRNNPGEDFNCRCVAIPIVRLAGEA
jgi:SPP1 gp7 family putative phage head morphogenesis protein